MKYDNFVFYGSWRESLEGFREEFGDDYAKEALWNLMLVATAGDIETERKSIIGFINGAVMPNVNKAKDRYAAAVENGKKGGRPKKIDDDRVLELKKQGMTNKQVAEALGCSISSIEKINAESRKNQNNQKNQGIIVIENQETRKNQKNLDIDIDIDIDNEKEIEKEKDIFAFSWFDDEKEEENGKKGGRPKVNLNEQAVLEKKKELGTWKETAQFFGVTEQSLKNYRNQWENEKNPNNPNTAIVKNPKNPKNLNDNVNVNVNVNDNVNVNENEKEKDIFAFSWFDDEKEEERKRKIVESAKQVRLAAIRKNPDNRFRDEEEQEYFDFIKGANIEKGMSETAAEADAWQMILDEREYNVSKIS